MNWVEWWNYCSKYLLPTVCKHAVSKSRPSSGNITAQHHMTPKPSTQHLHTRLTWPSGFVCLFVCIPLIWIDISLSGRGGCLWYSWALHLKPQTVWLFVMSWWQFKAIGKQCLVPLCASFFGNYLFLICKKAVNDIKLFRIWLIHEQLLIWTDPKPVKPKDLLCQPQWLLVSDNFSPCQIFGFPNYVWSQYTPGRSPEDVPSHPHSKVAFCPEIVPK